MVLLFRLCLILRCKRRTPRFEPMREFEKVIVSTTGRLSGSHPRSHFCDLASNLCQQYCLKYVVVMEPTHHCRVSSTVRVDAATFGWMLPCKLGAGQLGFYQTGQTLPHKSSAAQWIQALSQCRCSNSDAASRVDAGQRDTWLHGHASTLLHHAAGSKRITSAQSQSTLHHRVRTFT